MRKIPNLRWWITALLAAASGLAYVDRQALPLVIGEIGRTIRITDADYAHLQSLFLLAYGVMYIGAGRITDIVGARWGYVIFIVWWSAASLLQGTVSGISGLRLGLFLLGLGEGGCFPIASKAISEWLSTRERSIAFGLLNAGSSCGATIAPPLIALIVSLLNWRWVFFLTGTAGFVWSLAWFALYRTPQEHKRITPRELGYLRSTMTPPATTRETRTSWVEYLGSRQLQGLIVAKVLSDAAWFFLILWLPKYLYDARHLNIKAVGYYAWIPYAGAALGSIAGGSLSSDLLRRNFSLDQSRKICLAISAMCLPLSLLVTLSPLPLTIVFFSLAMLGHQSWATLIFSVTTDMFPSAVIGSISGLLGAVGAFGGMFLNLAAGGLLAQYHNYVPIFTIVGMLHPVSLIVILLVVRRIEPIASPRLLRQPTHDAGESQPAAARPAGPAAS